jgi:CPA2 family monovalent cation:H+ antiporter-2
MLPDKWIMRLDVYSSEAQRNKDNPLWKRMMRELNRILITNSVILIAIAFLFKYTFAPFLNTQIDSTLWRNVVLISTAILLSSPFLWAILIKKIRLKEDEGAVNSYYLNYSLIGISLHAIRYLIGIFLIGFLIDQITTTRYALMIAVPVVVAMLWFFSDKVQRIHQRIEQGFLSNLNEREWQEYIQNKGNIELQSKNEEARMHLQEWNAYVAELEAKETIFFAGMTLYELDWKRLYGINVAYIRRHDRTLHLPDGKQRILPYDKVGILGTEEQISKLKLLFDQTDNVSYKEDDIDINDIGLIKVQVAEGNSYSGKTIKASRIRKDLRSHVVGIERNGDRILNPGSSELILTHDIVWLVGDKNRIDQCLKDRYESFREV